MDFPDWRLPHGFPMFHHRFQEEPETPESVRTVGAAVVPLRTGRIKLTTLPPTRDPVVRPQKV